MDEIDTFNSYIGDIRIEGDVLSILFFNIGVSNHVLNEGENMKYIDRSVMVFNRVSSFIEDYSLDVVADTGVRPYYVGGYLMKDGVHKEFQVLCADAFLKVPDDFRISENMWNPYNMTKSVVRKFLEKHE
ncbi:hypothetical protein [Sphingobacterium kyonggiense]